MRAARCRSRPWLSRRVLPARLPGQSLAVWCACKMTSARSHDPRCGAASTRRDQLRMLVRPYPDQFALKQHVTEARDRARTLCGSLNARVQHAENILEVLYTKFKSGLRCTQIKCCVMIRRNDFKRSANIACREGGMRKGLSRVTGASGSQSGSFILTLCNNRTC